MIPFNLKCYNEDTGVDEYVKIGLFLQNPEDNKKLVCDNFVFETNIKYNYSTPTAMVTVALTDGTTHKKYKMIGNGHAKTVEIESKKYFVLDSLIKFPVLDDNNSIKYPFEALSIRYDTSHNRFIGKINTIQNFPYSNIQFPQDEIFKPKIIEKVKKISGVDISSVKERYTMGYSENKLINVHMLRNYIDCYSEIKEFRECIEKGVDNAYRWVVYKPETVKKKAKEVFAQLNNISIANISDLPLYIKEYIENDKSRDGEKNILSLYRRKFTEEEFKTYKKIFKNFGNVGNKRYEHFESFVIKFLGNNASPKEILYYITLNTAKGKGCSPADFFCSFEIFENKKKYENIDVEEEMAKAIFAGEFKAKKENINARVAEIKQFMSFEAFRQYGNVDLSSIDQWDLPMVAFRIKEQKDVPKLFSRECEFNRSLIPKTDEIVFILNTHSNFSFEDDMDKYLIVNLREQTYRIYGPVETNYSRSKYIGLLYDTKGDRTGYKEGKAGYFDRYMTDNDIKLINKMLAEYVYPKYIGQKVGEIF